MKRYIAFMLLILILFSQVVYADDEPTSEPLLDTTEVEVTTDPSLIDIGGASPIGFENFEFDIDFFEKLTLEMLNDSSLTKEVSYMNYFNNVQTDSKLLNFPLFTKNKSTRESDKVIFNNNFSNLDFFSFKRIKNLYSPYLASSYTYTENSFAGNGGVGTSFQNYHIISVLKNVPDILSNKMYMMMDNYGNIIASDGSVVLPYYNNQYFIARVLDKLDNSLVNRYTVSYSSVDILPEFTLTQEYLNGLYGPELKYADHVLNIGAFTRSGSRINMNYKSVKVKELSNLYSSGPVLTNEEKSAYLVQAFKDVIKEYNLNIIDTEKRIQAKGEESTLNIGTLPYSSSLEEDLDSILANLMLTLLTQGPGELIELSQAYILSRAYEEWFIDTFSNFIFNIKTLRDESFYYNIVNSYFAITISLIVFLFMLSLIRFILGQRSIKSFATGIILLILTFLIPFQIYPLVAKYTMTKPLEYMMDGQVYKFMVMDRWLKLDYDNFESTKKLLPFETKRVFRKSEYNYTVPIRTNELIMDKTFTFEEELANMVAMTQETLIAKSKSTEDRYTVDVEMNDLLEYFKSNTNSIYRGKASGLTFFEFLTQEKGSSYNNVSYFNEFGYYIDKESRDITANPLTHNAIVKGTLDSSGFVSFTDIGKHVFEYYDKVKMSSVTKGINSSVVNFGFDKNDLSERAKAVAYTVVHNRNYGIQEKLQLLRKLHSGVISYDFRGNLIYDYTDSAIYASMPSGAQKDALIVETEFLNAIVNEASMDSGEMASDTFMIYNLLYSMSKSATHTPTEGETVKLRSAATRLNTELMDFYLANFWDISHTRLGDSSIGSAIYSEALNDMLMLKLTFLISEEFFEGRPSLAHQQRFPTAIDFGNVQGDVYMRSLFIPLQEISPSNRNTDTTAIYLSMTKGFLTNFVFGIAVVFLSIYGILKQFLIGYLIVPIAVVITTFHYLVDTKKISRFSPWIGATWLLGIFSAVNLGLIGLISVTSKILNANSLNLAQSASSLSPFITSIILILYLGITMLFVLFPATKTAVLNPSDLGAAKFNTAFGDMVGKFKGTIESLRSEDKTAPKKGTDKQPKDAKEKLEDHKKDIGFEKKDETGYKSSRDAINIAKATLNVAEIKGQSPEDTSLFKVDKGIGSSDVIESSNKLLNNYLTENAGSTKDNLSLVKDLEEGLGVLSKAESPSKESQATGTVTVTGDVVKLENLSLDLKSNNIAHTVTKSEDGSIASITTEESSLETLDTDKEGLEITPNTENLRTLPNDASYMKALKTLAKVGNRSDILSELELAETSENHTISEKSYDELMSLHSDLKSGGKIFKSSQHNGAFVQSAINTDVGSDVSDVETGFEGTEVESSSAESLLSEIDSTPKQAKVEFSDEFKSAVKQSPRLDLGDSTEVSVDTDLSEELMVDSDVVFDTTTVKQESTQRPQFDRSSALNVELDDEIELVSHESDSDIDLHSSSSRTTVPPIQKPQSSVNVKSVDLRDTKIDQDEIELDSESTDVSSVDSTSESILLDKRTDDSKLSAEKQRELFKQRLAQAARDKNK